MVFFVTDKGTIRGCSYDSVQTEKEVGMSTVQVPIRICITSSAMEQALCAGVESGPLIETMKRQGHEFVVDETLSQYDFICGPNCWYLIPEVAALFKLAV